MPPRPGSLSGSPPPRTDPKPSPASPRPPVTKNGSTSLPSARASDDDNDDNDDITDDYEVANKLDPFHDDSDLDHDQRSNRDEFIANTSANDASSFFGIESLRFSRTPGGVEGHIAFPVAGGRHYRLIASSDIRLPRSEWFTIDEFDVPAGSLETAADILLNPAVLRNAGNLFFHVEVSLTTPPP